MSHEASSKSHSSVKSARTRETSGNLISEAHDRQSNSQIGGVCDLRFAGSRFGADQISYRYIECRDILACLKILILYYSWEDQKKKKNLIDVSCLIDIILQKLCNLFLWKHTETTMSCLKPKCAQRKSVTPIYVPFAVTEWSEVCVFLPTHTYSLSWVFFFFPMGAGIESQQHASHNCSQSTLKSF